LPYRGVQAHSGDCVLIYLPFAEVSVDVFSLPLPGGDAVAPSGGRGKARS
jgi:hypothetical protein